MSNSNMLNLVNETIKSLNSRILDKLEEWGKTVQLTIDDENYFINFKEIKTKTLIQGTTDTYDFKLSTSLAMFNQIINNEVNPVEAVVSGEVAIEGSLTDALEFSEMMTSVSSPN